VTNAGLKPGDALVLTKPVGTGVISFAQQLGKTLPAALKAVSRSMSELNRIPSELMIEAGADACTDVTGFGLLGHLSEMVSQSGVTVEIDVNSIPVFEGVFDCIRNGLISGALERNKEYASRFVSGDTVPEEISYMLYDPQTSGGLLVGIPAEKAGLFLGRLKEKGVGRAAVIGKATGRSKGKILLKA